MIRRQVPELVVTQETDSLFQPPLMRLPNFCVLRDALSRGTMDALEEALIVCRGELRPISTVAIAAALLPNGCSSREQLRMRMPGDIFRR